MKLGTYRRFWNAWLRPFLDKLMQGSYVYDGQKYRDSLAGLWCTTLGINTILSVNCLFEVSVSAGVQQLSWPSAL